MVGLNGLTRHDQVYIWHFFLHGGPKFAHPSRVHFNKAAEEQKRGRRSQCGLTRPDRGIINPGYLKVLFTDAAGLMLVYGALGLMLMGILVMWRIIDIKV